MLRYILLNEYMALVSIQKNPKSVENDDPNGPDCHFLLSPTFFLHYYLCYSKYVLANLNVQKITNVLNQLFTITVIR